jgi:hypothetical protein
MECHPPSGLFNPSFEGALRDPACSSDTSLRTWKRTDCVATRQPSTTLVSLEVPPLNSSRRAALIVACCCTGVSEEAKHHSAQVLQEHGLDPDTGTTSIKQGRTSRRGSTSRTTSRRGSAEPMFEGKDPSNVERGLKAYVCLPHFRVEIKS